MKINYIVIRISCPSQNNQETPQLARPRRKSTIRYTENVGINLVTILVWFCVGGYGNCPAPDRSAQLKVHSQREIFCKLKDRSTGSEGKKERGTWSGKGRVIMWPGRNCRAWNFATAQIYTAENPRRAQSHLDSGGSLKSHNTNWLVPALNFSWILSSVFCLVTRLRAGQSRVWIWNFIKLIGRWYLTTSMPSRTGCT
jgi:hypothetical protein